MKTNNTDKYIEWILRDLFLALLVLASGIELVQKFWSIIAMVTGYGLIVTAVVYMIYLAVMVSVIKSRS